MKTLVKAVNSNKISFDFHGVINQRPQLIKSLATLALKHKCAVYIVSGGPCDYIKNYLQQQQIPYTKIWCIYDFYEKKDLVKFLPNGEFHIDDELWDKAKGDYCRRNKISLHIDDSTVYGKYFTTPYAHFDARHNIMHLPQQDISLDLDAATIFAQIAEFLP